MWSFFVSSAACSSNLTSKPAGIVMPSATFRHSYDGTNTGGGEGSAGKAAAAVQSSGSKSAVVLKDEPPCGCAVACRIIAITKSVVVLNGEPPSADEEVARMNRPLRTPA